MPKPYVIEFDNMSENSTLASDKALFTEVRNIEPFYRGRFRKRTGYENLSTNATPDTSATAINAVVPMLRQPSGVLQYNLVAGDDGTLYRSAIFQRGGAWTSLTTGMTDDYPYIQAWGTDDQAQNNPAVFMANNGVWMANPAATAIKLGSSSDGSNPFSTANVVEYFLERVWVADTTESAGRFRAYLRGSITDDPNDFYSSDNILLKIGGGFAAGGGIAPTIKGLRVYRERMYILTEIALYVLNGITKATFGTSYIREVYDPNGATLFAVEDLLYWVDKKGVWQFDGTRARNIVMDHKASDFLALSPANDIARASATWNLISGEYIVWFPAVAQLWRYNYRRDTWQLDTPGGGDAIRCISPPTTSYGNTANAFCLGAVTNGSVFITNDTVVTDDGSAITASFKTGHIRLGEVNGNAGSWFVITEVDIETAQQDAAGVVKLTFTIDGTAQTTASLTVADTEASNDDFPTFYDGKYNTNIDLGGITLRGRTCQVEISDDDADARCDIRRITIWYDEERR